MNKILLACGAWGEGSFVDNYVKYIYPNHMACLKKLNDNFDDLECEYCFYTNVEDIYKLTSSPTIPLNYVDAVPANIDHLIRSYNALDGNIHGKGNMISFPNYGVFKVDNELIYYTKGSPMQRGVLGTTAVPHNVGTPMIMQMQVINSELSESLLPNLKVITEPGGFTGYGLGRIQTLSMRRAADLGSSVFILSADCIYPIDTFYNMIKLAKTTDKNIFFIPPYRVTHSIKPYLNDCGYSSRDLIGLTMKHLHPKYLRHFMENYSTYYYTTFCWRFKDTGFLTRAFHMHPIFFRRPSLTYANDVIDQSGYLERDFTVKDVYVVTDSDIGACIDIDGDPAKTVLDLTGYHINPKKGEMLSYAKVQPMHSILRELMRHKLYIHSEDITDEWKPLELASDVFVSETYGSWLNS